MLIDTHSHLHFSGYDLDRAEVHVRMAEFDVKTITVGTAMNTSRAAVAYADQHPDTWASVGYHPDHVTSNHVDEDEVGALDEPFDANGLELIATSSPRVIAIGETGLDYHYYGGDQNLSPASWEKGGVEGGSKQLKVFLAHVEIAAKLDKTLIVHSRDAANDMLVAIEDTRHRHPTLRIVIHGFSSSWKEAAAFLDLGCYLGIGGIVTFKPRKGTAAEDVLGSIASRIPLERLLVETDAPWLAPVPVRGTRNEPSHVRHVAQHIANLRGLEFDKLCEITTNNAKEAFNCEF